MELIRADNLVLNLSVLTYNDSELNIATTLISKACRSRRHSYLGKLLYILYGNPVREEDFLSLACISVLVVQLLNLTVLLLRYP